MKKKLFSVILLILVLLSTNIFATTINSEKATLEIVENNICTINITDKAIFEKKIIDYNLEKKEFTIGLKVTNNAVAPLNKPSEIVLVIDNSLSMGNTISTGDTRMEAVTNSAKVLATELLKQDTVKLSVVSFSTGPNEGTLTDAQLRIGLSNSKDDILNAITEISDDLLDLIENPSVDSTGARTNIEAGITLASKQFTGTCESQFIILLTDGVPNISLGSNKILYSGTTAVNTKNALIEIDNSNIQILSMMTGVTNSIESQTGMTYKELAEEVFGTPEKPTVGKFYYITDEEIEETVSETILKQLVSPTDDILTDLDIYDYFPQDIIDNFNFEYVNSPSIGTASEDIDLQNNLINWHIDELAYGESATLSYRLTLKDNINQEIIGILLDTNEKVDITTNKVLDDSGMKKLITSDITPKVRLALEQKSDTTITPEPLPQAGSTITFTIIIIVAIVLCISIGIKFYIKNKELK